MLCRDCKHHRPDSVKHAEACLAIETRNGPDPTPIRTARIVFCNDADKEPQYWEVK